MSNITMDDNVESSWDGVTERRSHRGWFGALDSTKGAVLALLTACMIGAGGSSALFAWAGRDRLERHVGDGHPESVLDSIGEVSRAVTTITVEFRQTFERQECLLEELIKAVEDRPDVRVSRCATTAGRRDD